MTMKRGWRIDQGKAHNLILAWCRSDTSKQLVGASPGMRERADGTLVVVALDRTRWELGQAIDHSMPIYYGAGDTWTEVLASLQWWLGRDIGSVQQLVEEDVAGRGNDPHRTE